MSYQPPSMPHPPPPPTYTLQAPMHHPPPPPLQPSMQPLPAPIPWLLISDNEIRSAQSNTPIFTISKSSSLSGRSTTTLTRTASGTPLGSIHFHTQSIELHMNGVVNKMKDDGMLSFRWTFRPFVFPGVKWFWSDVEEQLRLTDSNGKGEGQQIAVVNGTTLVCENIGLPEAAIDEVVLSAVAMLVKKKKLKRDEKGAEGVGELVNALLAGG